MLKTIVIDRIVRVRSSLPRDVYWWAMAALLALIALLAARLFWIAITPLGPFGAWQPPQAQLMSPAARLSLIAAYNPFGGDTADDGVSEITDLDIELFGTRENRGMNGGSAIIAGPDGVQQSVGVGEDIMPGVRLSAVAFDHIVIDRGGRREKLFLDQSIPVEVVTAGADAGGEAAPATAPGGDSLTAAAIRQGIGFAPRLESGRVTGVVLSPQGDGRIFTAAGFRSGDIVTAVNGRRITSQADIAALSGQLAPGSRLSITVERGAESVPVALSIADLSS